MNIISSGTSIDLNLEEILLNDKPKKWYQKLKLTKFIKKIFYFFRN